MGLGAGIAVAVSMAVFFALQTFGAGVYSDGAADHAGADGTERALVLIPSLGDAATGGQEGQPSPDRITVSTFLENGSPILGSPDAPVTLVEFGDYQCHFCSVFFNDTKDAIVKDYIESGHVKMIFKDYHIIGPDSVTASHAAHCAGDQGLFWEYHDALYERWAGENTGWASYENIIVIASDVPDLDRDAWQACLDDRDHSLRIHKSNEDARVLGLTGTPSFFVIGPDGRANLIVGAEEYAFFADRLDAAIAGDGRDAAGS